MTSALDIAFVGAGGVNFGGAEGPWDHASRLEKLEGIRLAGVADPNTEKAGARLGERSGPMYDSTRVFADYRDMLSELDLDAVWIGVPPSAHGTLEDDKDIEATCARAGVNMFVEKPLSAARPDKVREVAEVIANSDVLVSVGYMFRYSQAVDEMREILTSTDGGARAFIALYDCAYSCIRKTSWWDMASSGGPIVEQATHFIDLARYLVGDADLETLSGVSIQPDEEKGNLSDLPVRGDGLSFQDPVPAERRVPRATAATWKFQNGAIGTLNHGVLLHEKRYESEIEIWGDGLRMVLQDPYDKCRLDVRRPHREETRRRQFDDDDPYFTENQAFVEAIRENDPSLIRSTYADALKTFELTWAITDATGEAGRGE